MGNNVTKENNQHLIGLIGQGTIYQSVKRHLEGTYQLIPLTTNSSPQQLARCKIVLYCSDIWSPGILREINRSCLQTNVALLPVYTQFSEGIIGPCVVPEAKGCTSCAELRKLGATSSEPERELLHQYLYEDCQLLVSQPWLSSFSVEMLAVLVEEEVIRYFRRPSQLRTSRTLLSISLETLDCHKHFFLPLSDCPDCGELVNDTPEMAIITLQSCPKLDTFTYRIRQPEATIQRLLSTYVDGRTGLICSLTTENKNLLPITSSVLCFEAHNGEETIGTGCTLRTEQSNVIAILEATERYAGLRPRNKRPAAQASYHQLIAQTQPVLDPTTLGLHSPEQYEQYSQNHYHPHLIPYHHDLVCNWVWGYSFQRQSPILIPEHCAYYGIPVSRENPSFVYEISNGCALGNSLEEAIFHGITEVVERDAFLLTWYAQLHLPHLDLLSVEDPLIRLLIEHLEYHSGYTIHALNASLDHAIPCLCLLGIDEQNREGMPKAHVVAGSHPHPEQALLRALRELATLFALPLQSYQERRTEALKMLTNSSLVKTMEDHPLVSYLPEAFDRLDFLYHVQQQQSFHEAFGDFYHHPPCNTDLRDDLKYLINYYLKRGIDTIVVDQTAPEHAFSSLRCVKVLMPGMLPMTFGQHNRRIIGFERLHQLPFTLGYRSYPLTEAEINPYPHPFY